MEGLNKLLDKCSGTYWNQQDFQREVNLIQDELPAHLCLDAQNVQNCLCEFHKWTRGYSRTKYNGGA